MQAFIARTAHWLFFAAFAASSPLFLHAQNIYSALPVGKYAVGFKIITITDSSRISAPEYNYLGEKNEGSRLKKITIHLWYPAQDEPSKKRMAYGDYCYNDLLDSTGQALDTAMQNKRVRAERSAVERWFGPTTDSEWQKLVSAPMLARVGAPQAPVKCPLLIGQLRALSTTITNEMLASNGYVVAMVKEENLPTVADCALEAIPDMQFAMQYLSNSPYIDAATPGTFGFSGSGFIQVLFGMHDSRIKAVADIESGIYMDVLFQNFSASNYYQPGNLQIPFLHIFTRDLSKQEKFISDFENKTNHSTRYRLIVNQPEMHHWDNAAEGYTACMFLHNRGTKAVPTMRCFEIESYYLLNFFNATLKDDSRAKAFLSSKPRLNDISPALWDIAVLNGVKRAPTINELLSIIEKRGIGQAMDIVNNTIATDSTTDLHLGYMINSIGYNYLRQKKYDEAIALFKLNTRLHPNELNYFDSLAEGYETAGDKDNMKTAAKRVLELIAQKTTLNDGDKSAKTVNEKRAQE